MKKKVVVGMSGGVDSSVTAHILKKQGYDVIGMTMKVFPGNNCKNSQKQLEIIESAKKVCEDLEIPFYVADLVDVFKAKVVDSFADEYMKGRTPNPCVVCNKYIKFDAFLNKAKELGAEYIATGHYAQIEKQGDRYIIRKGIDPKKDQTYMLYNMKQEQLKHVLMPCGTYTKDKIREMAKEIGLEVYNKKDSQEICFIPDGNHGEYIENQLKIDVKKGNFVDRKGNVLGRHKGIIHYTIGQRKGLGIALGTPVFVVDIIPSTNQVVLGSEDEIFKKQCIAKDINFIFFHRLEEPLRVQAKIRYSARTAMATILPIGEDSIKVVFDENQRAMTKGQSVVFYIEDILVGGGIIDQIL